MKEKFVTNQREGIIRSPLVNEEEIFKRSSKDYELLFTIIQSKDLMVTVGFLTRVKANASVFSPLETQ